MTSFLQRVFEYPRSGVLTALAWLVPHETASVSAQVLYIPYNHAPCHFMQNHIRKAYACSAVTCHLHFWQNDRILLRATAVTRGWNGYRNKSQHRKLTMEKNNLPSLLRDSNPRPFNQESGDLTTELSRSLILCILCSPASWTRKQRHSLNLAPSTTLAEKPGCPVGPRTDMQPPSSMLSS